MLNKLSFNLMNELNESETRRYKVKKKVLIESDYIRKEEIKEDTEEYLDTRYDPRKSFYKKARVVTKDNGDEELYSYDTHVGGIRGGKPYSKGKYSQTTTRHQKEFFKQRGHELKDVPVELDEKVKEKPITEATDINFKNLSNDQRLELKQRILSDKYNKENKEPSYSELADDEKKAIEDEIASIEKELEEGCNKSLKEDYSERLGGDPEDFISDMKSLLYQLRTIEVENFGTNLAKQIVYDFEETVQNQMKMIANKYDLEESKKVENKPIVEAAETEVKDLQVIKEQGNVYMLEDKSEGTRYIVGENYNLSEGEIENAEIYENKEEADKDYLDRCEIMKDGEQLDAGNEETADIE